MGLEDIFIRALTVEYVNVTSNSSNGTLMVQRCFAKSSLDADSVHIFDFYLHVFVMSIIIGLGLFGNTLLIWISAKKFAFTTNYFLMMIALADTFVLLMYLLYFTLPSTYEFLGFAEEYFKVFSSTQEYIWFVFTTCKAISTYGVVLMLADRYAWLNTQRRRSGSMSNITNARLAIALVLALAILFAFPKMLLFETSLAHDPCRDIYALNMETQKGLIYNQNFMIAYEATTEFIISFAFPVLCMLPLLRGIYRWKVTWAKQLYPYTSRMSSEANSSNHLLQDGHVSSPESRTPSTLETASRATSDRIDADSSSALIGNNDVSRRVHQPLLDKHNIQDNQNNECHVTVDLRKRLTAITISFILLETPNRLFQLIILVNRIRNDHRSEPLQSTVFLAELLNALAIVHYGIKFYLCLFFCNSFKEQCGKTLWCYASGHSNNRLSNPEQNHRPAGKDYGPVRPSRSGDETPPYGQADDWV